MEKPKRLIDRWREERCGFVWKGTRQEFEASEGLILQSNNGNEYRYTNKDGDVYIFNDNNKTWYIE